ncbi:hypothetical protein OK607_02650, partial [Streptococcus pneumoniae]|nr:hypothetical protein [Streptococcus pneumoniae]
YQKRKDEICPFSSLAFFQPTTVDKESENTQKRLLTKLFLRKKQFRKQASTIPTYDECSR